MVKANRTTRLEQERANRKQARRDRLEEILDEIAAADIPLLTTRLLHPAPSSSASSSAVPVRVSYRRLFPSIADLLEYPIIKGLDKTDVPTSKMRARLEAHRETMKAHVLEWRVTVEGYLAEVIREGCVADGLKKIATVPSLSVEKSEPNPFNGVSDDLKLLLRADSLFESRAGIPFVYNSQLCTSLSSIWISGSEAPLDLSIYKRHKKGQ